MRARHPEAPDTMERFATTAPSVANRGGAAGQVLLRFGRPHTLIGTSVSVAGLFAIATSGAVLPAAISVVGVLASAWVSALAANMFIVGLNQITDVSIDRLNKPDLPLAAGSMSPRAATVVVVAAAVISIAVGALVSPFLVVTVAASMAIGAAYSLPPLRLKRTAFWAAASIAAVRGVLVNGGLYVSFRDALGLSTAVPPAIQALVMLVVGFAVAIALAKDVPDMVGDRVHGIRSLTVRWGQRRAWRSAIAVLAACYLATIVVGSTVGIPGTNSAVLVSGHVLLLAALWAGTRRTDALSPSSVRDGYRFIWRLFYAEYLVFPAACLLATVA